MPGKKPTHTGRDATKEATGIKHEISIHAPHTGRDMLRSWLACIWRRFQSTRPIRGATITRISYLSHLKIFQSTRPIRGATYDRAGPRNLNNISIHAPHAGRDIICLVRGGQS